MDKFHIADERHNCYRFSVEKLNYTEGPFVFWFHFVVGDGRTTASLVVPSAAKQNLLSFSSCNSSLNRFILKIYETFVVSEDAVEDAINNAIENFN